MHPNSYSVVIPVFNSASILPRTIERTVSFFEGLGFAYQLVLVDDGSRDESWRCIEAACRQNPRITGVRLLKNYGQHSAIFCGFAHARGDFVITMDDDLQNPPEELIHLIRKIEDGGYDLVFGRFKEKKHSGFRRWGSKVIGRLNEAIFDKPEDLVLTNFRIARKSVIERCIRYQTPHPYIPGLLLLHAGDVANVEVEHHERAEGASNYTPGRILALTARLLFNYSSLPLKWICSVGIFASGLSFLLGLYFIFKRLFLGVEVQGWTTLAVLLSFFSGLIILILGVMGEYLGRLLKQVSEPVPYLEKESLNDP